MDITKETKEKLKKTVFKEPFSYRKLFISTFLISAFTVGGGFVLIPLMKAKFVDEYGWLEENEALDLVSIAQSAPGVMAANSSIIMGYRMGGFLGSLTALLATVLPPLITLTVISFFYDAFASNPYVRMFLKGMQCGVTAILCHGGNLYCRGCFQNQHHAYYSSGRHHRTVSDARPPI